MLIELLKNKEPEFNRCQCAGYDYHRDIKNLGDWITVDYKLLSGRKRSSTGACVQFPFTYDEYNRDRGGKYTCPKCNTFPYRIIENNQIPR